MYVGVFSSLLLIGEFKNEKKAQLFCQLAIWNWLQLSPSLPHCTVADRRDGVGEEMQKQVFRYRRRCALHGLGEVLSCFYTKEWVNSVLFLLPPVTVAGGDHSSYSWNGGTVSSPPCAFLARQALCRGGRGFFLPSEGTW